MTVTAVTCEEFEAPALRQRDHVWERHNGDLVPTPAFRWRHDVRISCICPSERCVIACRRPANDGDMRTMHITDAVVLRRLPGVTIDPGLLIAS